MDRKSLIAIVVCSCFYFGYEYYLNQKYPDRFTPKTSTSSAPEAAPTSASPLNTSTQLGSPTAATAVTTASSANTIPMLQLEELALENGTSRYQFNQQTGGMEQVILKQYQNDARSGPMKLLESPWLLQPSLPTETQLHEGFEAHRLDDHTLVFRRDTPEWRLEHRFAIPESGYGMDITCSWENLTTNTRNLDTLVRMSQDVPFAPAKSSFLQASPVQRHSVVATLNTKTEWEDVEKYCKDADKTEPLFAGINQSLEMIGFDHHYFLAAVLPRATNITVGVTKAPGTHTTHCPMFVTQLSSQGSVAPHTKVELHYKSWMGPKSPELLRAYDDKLEQAIDLGFFNLVGRLLLQAIHLVHSWVHNWGLAIILFTLFLKFLFYPLTKQASVAMKRAQKFNPELAQIREKFKADPTRQQQEVMKFMALHKINPLKGCLPILPTIPVFFAFYRVLPTSIELRHAPFVGWIQDLSAADPYYITPILLGVCMFVQQKLTPTTGLDKTQEKMMMIMPIVFAAMMLTLPAGLVLYMLTNTLVSIGQQRWLNRKPA